MNQNKIYVGGLSYNTTEDTLRSVFSKFGEITDLVIIKDRETRRSKGFGFVTFTDSSSAEASLEMTGQELDGRTLKVSMAEDKKTGGTGGSSGSGSGGGRRSSGGGGGRW